MVVVFCSLADSGAISIFYVVFFFMGLIEQCFYFAPFLYGMVLVFLLNKTVISVVVLTTGHSHF